MPEIVAQDDIVYRLKNQQIYNSTKSFDQAFDLMDEAADEIQILRKSLQIHQKSLQHSDTEREIWREKFLALSNEVQSLPSKPEIVWEDNSKDLTFSQRLRILHCAKDELTHCGTCMTCRAADEIERLSKEVIELRIDNAGLKAKLEVYDVYMQKSVLVHPDEVIHD